MMRHARRAPFGSDRRDARYRYTAHPHLERICDSLNGHTAGQAATADTRPINVGAAQMATFLALLSGQIAMHIPAGLPLHEAELYSLATRKKKSTDRAVASGLHRPLARHRGAA